MKFIIFYLIFSFYTFIAFISKCARGFGRSEETCDTDVRLAAQKTKVKNIFIDRIRVLEIELSVVGFKYEYVRLIFSILICHSYFNRLGFKHLTTCEFYYLIKCVIYLIG